MSDLSDLSSILGVGLDWLDARVQMPFTDAVALLERMVPDTFDVIDEETGEVRSGKLEVCEWAAPGRLGYARAVEVKGPPTSGSLRLLGEHPSARGWSMFSASQNCAGWLYRQLRTLQIQHEGFEVQVNRMDVAVDFMLPKDLQPALFGEVEAYCRSQGVKKHEMGDFEAGKTMYVGWAPKKQHLKSRTNGAPIHSGRLYQKGLEQGAGTIEGDGAPSEDWMRWEHIYRPDKPEYKARAFTMEPNEVLGSRDWGLHILALIGYGDASEGPRIEWPKSDGDELADDKARQAKAMRTLAHMVDQYRNAAQDLAELVGWDRVSSMIVEALQEQKASGAAPGDVIRAKADMLWCDRFDERFKSPDRPAWTVVDDGSDKLH